MAAGESLLLLYIARGGGAEEEVCFLPVGELPARRRGGGGRETPTLPPGDLTKPKTE